MAAEQLSGVNAWSGPADGSEIVKAYGAEAIPTLLLIGPDGKVLVATHDAWSLTPAIEAALAEHH